MKSNREVCMLELEKLNEVYVKDKTQNVLRHALHRTAMDDVVSVMEAYQYTKNMFTIDIDTMSATNQMRSGRCWIFAGLNVLRERIAKAHKIKDFELSQNYVAFYDKYEKINYLLEAIFELKDKDHDDRTLSYLLQTGIQDGGQWDMLVNVIEKYGLVSKQAMPETYQSSHTQTMNQMINTRMRKFAADVKRMHNAGNDDDIIAYKKEVLKEMYGMLCSCFGIPPKQFDFEYVDDKKVYHKEKGITPMQFYKEYAGGDLRDYVSIINAPTKDKPFDKTFTVKYLNNVIGGKDIQYLNQHMDEFKKLIIKQLEDKEPVWFGSDCSFYGDKKLDVWDDQAFDYESAFGIDFSISKEDMLNYRDSMMNHAMVITGVSLDEGKPCKWKIENSWGSEKKANDGYHIASDSWFDRYVYQAVVHKKYLSDAQKEMLKQEPIALEPWDPMGSLAD